VPTDKHGNVGWVVRARKAHRCEARNDGCLGVILPGTLYYRAVAFPGHDANGGRTPWVMRICRSCLHDEHRALFDSVAESSEGEPS
jgi:hypothetical protein